MTKQQHRQGNRPTTSEKLMMNIRGLEDAINRNLYHAAGAWLISIYEYENTLNNIVDCYITYNKE